LLDFFLFGKIPTLFFEVIEDIFVDPKQKR